MQLQKLGHIVQVTKFAVDRNCAIMGIAKIWSEKNCFLLSKVQIHLFLVIIRLL